MQLVDITNQKDIVVAETFITNNGIDVYHISNFNNLTREISVLQLRGKSDNIVQIFSVEFNMCN